MAVDLKKIKGLFLDMDGVLWSDTLEIGNLAQIFTDIEALGLKIMYGSNNSTKVPEEYIEKLASFGVHAKKEQFFTAAVATVAKLHEDFPTPPSIYVIGTESLKNMLRENGFTITDKNADVVLTSMDRGLNYDKVCCAMRLIKQGAKFYATNGDANYPTAEGWIPGAGTMMAAVAYSSETEPILIGKPNTIMMEMACHANGLKPEEVLAVGDRHETDILGGYNAGAGTVLVMTGYETSETLPKLEPQPDIVCADLTELVEKLKQVK